MADLIVRPDHAVHANPETRPDVPRKLGTITARDDSLAERLITTQSPQRPQSSRHRMTPSAKLSRLNRRILAQLVFMVPKVGQAVR